jgi:histidinol phosphatase-like PHP family hydrolase
MTAPATSSSATASGSDARHVDINAVAGALLRDLAYAQDSQQSMFGYKRAAAAVLSLERPLSDLAGADGQLERIAGIGPASTRVILEVLQTGSSAIVEQAIERSGRRADVERRRSMRVNFLSRAEVLRVLRDPSYAGPALHDYCGDLQMHSEWSDGVPTLDEIVEACLGRGYQYTAVTDHSYGLKIAGGMSMAEAAAQHREMDRLNGAYGGRFRLLRGIEANIAADGRLDLSAGEAAQFELVLAAPHSVLRKSHDQTPRLLAAIRNPAVHVLAHPRGRITGSRAGVIADWDAVFGIAAAEGVAIEIDGDPARQDLDFSLAARARAAGCIFALDSDAHATTQLRYAETAVAHARLASIPPARIVNCWPLERLLDWLRNRGHAILAIN